jgi:hypothetical protein
MNVRQDSTSRRRGLRGRRLVLVGALAAALVLAVPLAWASHQFNDVDNGNPFHNEISAIAGAGITAGKTCVPPGVAPTYCPNEGVTRQAMAAFMHRGYGRAAEDRGATVALSTSADTVIGHLTIDVPGVAGNTQFVKLDAPFTLFTGAGTCTYFVNIQRENGSASGWGHWVDVPAPGPSGAGGFESAGATFVDVVPSGTTQAYEVVVSPIAPCATGQGWAAMSAMTAPFGSTGGTTLGSASPGSPDGGPSGARPKSSR